MGRDDAVSGYPLWITATDPPGEGGEDAPALGPLKGALLTTYDAPDRAFLVEHLLPRWLGTDIVIPPERAEQRGAIMELAVALGRDEVGVTVVSSWPGAKGNDTIREHPWLDRYVRFLHVDGVTQHAKLRMLWRGAGEKESDAETLEVCVSSCNLSGSAFRKQVQAGWRCLVRLSKGEGSKKNLDTWGVLPEFIRRLGEATHDDRGRKGGLSSFVDLLKRAKCPDGAHFIASVPGTHGKDELSRRPWGSAGLKGAMPEGTKSRRVFVSAPTVGTWDSARLERWTSEIGADKLDVLVLEKSGSFQEMDDHWAIPQATVKTVAKLEGVESRFLTFAPHPKDPGIPRLHADQRENDRRWVHAKVYHFSTGKTLERNRVLITSANFTMAAWGRWTGNTLKIDNFELGVLIDNTRNPYDDKGYADEGDNGLSEVELEDVRTSESASDAVPAPSAILWAGAEWNGETLRVSCRSNPPDAPISPLIVYFYRDGETESSDRQIGEGEWRVELQEADAGDRGIRTLSVTWPASDGVPVRVRIRVREPAAEIEVTVADYSPKDAGGGLPGAGVTREALRRWRSKMLIDRYGGFSVVEDSSDFGEPRGSPAMGDTSGAPPADYSVRGFLQARGWFRSVDGLASLVARFSGDAVPRSVIRDAEEMLAYFEEMASRGAGPETDLSERDRQGVAAAARVVAEEIRWRLKAVKRESTDVAEKGEA